MYDLSNIPFTRPTVIYVFQSWSHFLDLHPLFMYSSDWGVIKCALSNFREFYSEDKIKTLVIRNYELGAHELSIPPRSMS